MSELELFFLIFLAGNFLLLIFGGKVGDCFYRLYSRNLDASRIRAEKVGFPDAFPKLNERLIRKTVYLIAVFNLLGAGLFWVILL